MIDEKGNRHFLTNPSGSLRRLSFEDIEGYLDDAAGIVSFAGMFVSPLLTIPEMKRLFSRIKDKKDRILAVDMTKAKNGEVLEDIQELLPYIDYIFPNEEEIALLTGERDPKRNASLLIERGVKTAVVKCGERGCIIADSSGVKHIPAVKAEKCVDTTGAGDSWITAFTVTYFEHIRIWNELHKGDPEHFTTECDREDYEDKLIDLAMCAGNLFARRNCLEKGSVGYGTEF